jgi:hypothetical protein
MEQVGILMNESGVTFEIVLGDVIWIRALPDGDEMQFDYRHVPPVYDSGVWFMDGLIFLIVEYRRQQ